MLLIFIHRLLQSFVLPPFNAMVILLFGLIILRWHRKTAVTAMVASLVILYLQSAPFLINLIAKVIEPQPLSQAALQDSQAIVVIGGGVQTNSYEYNLKLTPNGWTLLRLEYTAYLAKQYPNKIIVVSGGLDNGKQNSEADVMARVLKQEFQVTNPIIIEGKSRNTDENAKFVAQILKKLQIYNVVVVTQAFHANRATALFEKYGLHAVAAPTDFISNNRNLDLLSFIPNSDSMHSCAQILHEIYGYIIYVNMQ